MELPREINERLAPAFDAIDEFYERSLGIRGNVDLSIVVQKRSPPQPRFVYGRCATRA